MSNIVTHSKSTTLVKPVTTDFLMMSERHDLQNPDTYFQVSFVHDDGSHLNLKYSDTSLTKDEFWFLLDHSKSFEKIFITAQSSEITHPTAVPHMALKDASNILNEWLDSSPKDLKMIPELLATILDWLGTYDTSEIFIELRICDSQDSFSVQTLDIPEFIDFLHNGNKILGYLTA